MHEPLHSEELVAEVEDDHEHTEKKIKEGKIRKTVVKSSLTK